MFVMSGESYYQIGSLLPLPGSTTKFAKLYIYDNENEIDKDCSMLRELIVNDVKNVLDECYPYVQKYRIVHKNVLQNTMQTVKLKLYGKRGNDGNTYNFSTRSEVVGRIVGDFDATDVKRDVIVETRSKYCNKFLF
ncbi:hypothetical protein GmHk_05G013054 [Glycine max]|nr:hypothetical protein GmHk_05G013054 [Glycine max]